MLLLFFLSCTVMCPPNDILGSVYSMADMYRSRKMIETRSEIIISAVAMTVTYSTIGSREICTCYWFFLSLVIFCARISFVSCAFFCCFLFASTHFASWVLISYLQKNITLTSVCRKLFKVIKTSDVQTLLPMWQVPNLWAIFYSYQKRNLTSNQDSKDKDYSQMLTSSSQNKKQMCRMANQIAG